MASHKTSNRESQIAARMRQIREKLRLTQAEFADQLGITRQRLASYEEGRVAIRYDLALRLCRQFIVSEKWLATGSGDMRQVMSLLFDEAVRRIPLDCPFSKAYDEFLGPRFETLLLDFGRNARVTTLKDDDFGFLENLFSERMDYWLGGIKPYEIPTFYYSLIRFGTAWIAEREKKGSVPNFADLLPLLAQAPDNSGVIKEASEEQGLTSGSLKGNSECVTSEITKLIERVKRQAEKPGSRAQLARLLDVAPARITEWLKGKKEPGGNYTLRLLRWVEEQEQKKQ